MKRSRLAVLVGVLAAVLVFGVAPLAYISNYGVVYGTVTNFQDTRNNDANVTVTYHGMIYYVHVQCDYYKPGASFPLFYHPALLYMGNSSLYSDELLLHNGC